MGPMSRELLPQKLQGVARRPRNPPPPPPPGGRLPPPGGMPPPPPPPLLGRFVSAMKQTRLPEAALVPGVAPLPFLTKPRAVAGADAALHDPRPHTAGRRFHLCVLPDGDGREES